MGKDEILRRYVPEFERSQILAEAHGGTAGGHYARRVTAQNILCASVPTEEFQVYHQISKRYHPQANGTIESFNKILEIALTKVHNTQRSDWDLHILVVLWAYRTKCKKLMEQTPFRLVYGMEVVMLMEYIVPSLRIAVLIGMTYREALEERLAQLEEIEEEQFLAGFHQ
eukprot:PITA_04629